MNCMMNGLSLQIVSIFSILCCQVAYGLNEAVGQNGQNASAVHQKGITGAGVSVGLLSAGNVRAGHTAFERASGSAVTNYDFTESGLSRSSHDTEMAGIILSAGSPSHPDQIGVAPGVRLHSARFSNKQLYPSKVENALNTLIKNHHCRIIMTGIQLPREIVIADGNSNWTRLYDYYADTYDVIFAAAAGNSSPLVTVFGDCYNGITTAGMVKSDPNGLYDKIGPLSNPGPTADGRKKPDVAACTQGLVTPTGTGDNHWKTLDPDGRGLTSYAVPHTAGVAALLLEAAAKSTTKNDDKTEVIKAVIINSAAHIPPETGNHTGRWPDSISAWKPDSGYGKLNAFKAYQTLTAGPVSLDVPAEQYTGWAYGVIGKNKSHEYKIRGTKGQQLIVTITWHRKIQKIGNKYFDAPNRFYLDLKILSPSDKMITFETAGRNNLIKIDQFLKEDGIYTISLKNPTLAKDHDYGMAFDLIEAYE